MKIGLYGILGVYNFGCEAIVRGAYKFCKNIYPDAEIIYYSYNYEYDRKALYNLDIDVQKVKTRKNIISRATNKILKKINADKRLLYFDYKSIINNVDIIMSIGGDIYTIPWVLRQKNKYPYYNGLVQFCDLVVKGGKKVIVYGASIGPFGNYEKAKKYYMDHLKKYTLILCREKASLEYLKSNGLENAMFFPDPAFQVEGYKKKIREKQYIGINLSPLSLKEIYGTYDEKNCKKLASILDDICEKTQMKLLLIPHVISANVNDNDYIFLQKLKKLMKEKNQQKVTFADYEKGFLGIKEQLNECIVVASARMHCAINAVKQNVPTIFLSYSQKSIGMCQYIYESKEMVLDLKTIDQTLIPLIVASCHDADKITSYLYERNKQIEADYNRGIKVVQSRLRE